MLTIHSLLPLKTVRSVRWLRLSGILPRACALVLTLAIFWYLKVQHFLLSSHQIQEKNIQKSHRHYYTYCSAHALGNALCDPRLSSPTGLYTYQFAEKIKNLKKHLYDPVLPPILSFNARCAFFHLSILVERKRKRNPGSPKFLLFLLKLSVPFNGRCLNRFDCFGRNFFHHPTIFRLGKSKVRELQRKFIDKCTMSTTSIDVSAAMSKEILDTPLLSDDIFIIASEKFANLAHQEDTTDTEPIKYLKSRYRTHLEELLIESGFLGGAPLGDDLNTLVIVMLWDFVKRKFVSRGTRSKLQLGKRIEEVEEVETQLGNYAIKLAASLARMRIRESALTLGDTLSEELREQEHIRSQLPVYGWVNPRKARAKEISDELEAAGIEFEPGTGLQDGLFVFSHQFLTPIELSDAVREKKMLIVDSTSLVGPQAVANLLNGEESEDVLLCGGCTSSLPMLADVVVKAGKILDEELTQSRFLFASGDEPNTSQAKKPKLIVCMPTKKHQEVRDFMTENGVNEEVYEVVPPLSTMQPNDARLLHVKVVLIEPRCSLSAAADPLRFMLMEGLDDNDPRLHALAKGVSQPQEGLKLILAASLILPRSAATLYLTRSSLSKENEEVIQYGISQLPAKSEFKLAPVPLKMPIDVIEKGSAGKYLRLPASESGSGCFLACISRNILDSKHAARKSALKGLLAPPRRPKKESGLRGSGKVVIKPSPC